MDKLGQLVSTAKESAQKTVQQASNILFQQSLPDLIKGIREHTRDEQLYVTEQVRIIRNEFKTKKTSEYGLPLQKLAYLHLLGYDQSWAAFNVVQVMAQPKFFMKRIGYLTATQFFDEDSDCIMLATQTMKKVFIVSYFFYLIFVLGFQQQKPI